MTLHDPNHPPAWDDGVGLAFAGDELGEEDDAVEGEVDGVKATLFDLRAGVEVADGEVTPDLDFLAEAVAETVFEALDFVVDLVGVLDLLGVASAFFAGVFLTDFFGLFLGVLAFGVAVPFLLGVRAGVLAIFNSFGIQVRYFEDKRLHADSTSFSRVLSSLD